MRFWVFSWFYRSLTLALTVGSLSAHCRPNKLNDGAKLQQKNDIRKFVCHFWGFFGNYSSLFSSSGLFSNGSSWAVPSSIGRI